MKIALLLFVLPLAVHALDYKRDVMPIFKEKCYDCHSSKAKKVKGGLRLDDEKIFSKRFAKNGVVCDSRDAPPRKRRDAAKE